MPFFIEILAIAVVSAIIHESGHLLAALLTGTEIRGVGVNRRGFYVSVLVDPPRRIVRNFNLLGGPAANLAAFAITGGSFAAFNLLLFVLNLTLPGSDGWQIVRLWRRSRES